MKNFIYALFILLGTNSISSAATYSGNVDFSIPSDSREWILGYDILQSAQAPIMGGPFSVRNGDTIELFLTFGGRAITFQNLGQGLSDSGLLVDLLPSVNGMSGYQRFEMSSSAELLDYSGSVLTTELNSTATSGLFGIPVADARGNLTDTSVTFSRIKFSATFVSGIGNANSGEINLDGSDTSNIFSEVILRAYSDEVFVTDIATIPVPLGFPLLASSMFLLVASGKRFYKNTC